MKLTTDFGTYDVQIKTVTYGMNGNLAVRLVEKDGAPFATLTVNLGEKLPSTYAYVDTNNCPWAEEFIKQYNLGEPTGLGKRSGYCLYPLYQFNMKNLEAYK